MRFLKNKKKSGKSLPVFGEKPAPGSEYESFCDDMYKAAIQSFS